MADPVVKNIPKETWTIVATSVTCGIINKLAWEFDFYQTYRLTGTAAPTAITVTKVPEEAVPMFIESEQEIIVSSAAIDVYVCCFIKDNRLGSQGKVRVDV